MTHVMVMMAVVLAAADAVVSHRHHYQAILLPLHLPPPADHGL